LPPESSPPPTLRNILLLEKRRGYDDRAVVGGLTAFIAKISDTAWFEPTLIAAIQAYAHQPAAERQRTVESLLRALDEPRAPTPPQSAPATKAPTPPPSKPAQKPAAARSTVPKITGRLQAGAPVATMPGVGATRAKRLADMGIETVGDLRFHLPNRYVAYPPPQPAASLGFQHLASYEGIVRRVETNPMPGKRFRITAILGDSTGTVAAVWIRHGGPPAGIQQGMRLAVSGPLVSYGRQVYFENPEYEPADRPPLNTRRTVPVYPLTQGISQSLIRSLVGQALSGLPPIEDWLPGPLLRQEGLMARDEALREMHEPADDASLDRARLRLAFDELLPLQLLVLQKRMAYQATQGTAIEVPWGLLAEFRQRLPFALTGGQQRALSAILEDIAQPRPMVRLLQGEVGSGKTIVAAMALLSAIANGGQAALVAPTEILAEQHLQTITGLYDRIHDTLESTLGRRPNIALLSGALSRSARERTIASIGQGEIDLVVGTHAVIESDVEFPQLQLAVVDEQHRFGVNQRVAVRQKGGNPHLLVMTATPIPRTLALSLYGDLDVSIIDELPPGRQPVHTEMLRPIVRGRAYQHIREEVAAGRQAFVICPLVEESRTTEARSAVAEYERLQHDELAGLRLALLHGRMRPAEKDAVMRAFSDHETDVLIATSVVEVGIDVPNATVMVIEGAERFGLAQLHQFRGRVGRGSAPSACYLIAGSEAPDSLERLDVVAHSGNGLDLAEEDLRIRGPGEFYGLRQSGFPPLRVARLTDLELLQRVRAVAAGMLEHDPRLEWPEHAALGEAVARFGRNAGDAN